MPGRFSEVTSDVDDILHEVRQQYFPELVNAKILCLFDIKKRQSKGKIILARIKKSDDLVRHLTINETDNEEGFDYIVFIDQMIWTNIEREDKIRLIRHELRHTLYDVDSRTTPYKLISHDVEDFIAEIELNSDDLRWSQRVGELLEHLYSQERETEE